MSQSLVVQWIRAHGLRIYSLMYPLQIALFHTNHKLEMTMYTYSDISGCGLESGFFITSCYRKNSPSIQPNTNIWEGPVAECPMHLSWSRFYTAQTNIGHTRFYRGESKSGISIQLGILRNHGLFLRTVQTVNSWIDESAGLGLNFTASRSLGPIY